MPEHGKTVILFDGKRGLDSDGKGSLYNQDGDCSTCCCEPLLLAEKYLYSSYSENPSMFWDLTPYQGPSHAIPGSYWRLIEVSGCYPGEYPWYGAGCVDSSGTLVGLPSTFNSPARYQYMELQIGCLSADGSYIEWPGSCQTGSSVFPC